MDRGGIPVTIFASIIRVRTKLLDRLIVTRADRVIITKAAVVNASPNPVPAGEGLGRTTISWDSVDGKIYVAESGRDEVLLVDSPRGSQEVDWIGEASGYDFRLYNSDRTKLLDRVIVTKATGKQFRREDITTVGACAY